MQRATRAPRLPLRRAVPFLHPWTARSKPRPGHTRLRWSICSLLASKLEARRRRRRQARRQARRRYMWCHVAARADDSLATSLLLRACAAFCTFSHLTPYCHLSPSHIGRPDSRQDTRARPSSSGASGVRRCRAQPRWRRAGRRQPALALGLPRPRCATAAHVRLLLRLQPAAAAAHPRRRR